MLIICRTKWIVVNGQKYTKSVLVVVGIEDEYPSFGVIEDIFITNSNSAMLHVELCHTQSYNEHFHGYVVSRSNQFKVVSVQSLQSHVSTTLRSVQSEQSTIFIVNLKFHILNTLQA